MKHGQSIVKLAKFLTYVLGRQPDEFGLVLDEEGYVKAKDLIKALGEEDGWRHVRLNHLREVMYSAPSPTLEMKDKLIRAVDRSRSPKTRIPDEIPKLLYYPVRQRAYPSVLEKGIRSYGPENRLVLADTIEFSNRLGRRIDSSPVILTVNTNQAIEKGVILKCCGKLFIADCLPLGCFTGPPLPKDYHPAKKKDAPKIPEKPKTPGSYILDITQDVSEKDRSGKGSRKRKNEWKRHRKRQNRNKGFM